MFKKGLGILLAFLLVFCGCSSQNTVSYVNSDAVSGDEVVALSIDTSTLTSDGVKIEIKNLTDKEMTYETSFVLEQQTDDGWIWINTEQEFTALGCILAPNDTNTQSLKFIKTLDDGNYRITKNFYADGTKYECFVEFELI
ncbi:MAG: hypothetical protein IJ462_02980 [Clostridia bacterium]|nr:hypothetical protein [Clostridia bacterium]